MMASEYAETCRFINTNETSVLTYFAFYFISYRSRIQVRFPDAQRWRRRRMSVIRGLGLRQSSNPWSIGMSGSRGIRRSKVDGGGCAAKMWCVEQEIVMR